MDQLNRYDSPEKETNVEMAGIEAFETPSTETLSSTQPGGNAPTPPPVGLPSGVQQDGQTFQSAQHEDSTPEIAPVNMDVDLPASSADALPPVPAPPAPQQAESATPDATPVSAPPAPVDASEPPQSDEQPKGDTAGADTAGADTAGAGEQTENPSSDTADKPPSNQTPAVLKWLMAKDSNPAPFELRLKKTYKAHFNGDMIVDEESGTEHASVMVWAKARKSEEDGKECKGISVKGYIYYNDKSITKHEEEIYKNAPASGEAKDTTTPRRRSAGAGAAGGSGKKEKASPAVKEVKESVPKIKLPSSEPMPLLKWLTEKDPAPEPVQLRLKKTYTGSVKGESVVDDETSVEYACPMLWAKARKTEEDGKEARGGGSMKTYVVYKGLTLQQHEENLFRGAKHHSGTPPFYKALPIANPNAKTPKTPDAKEGTPSRRAREDDGKSPAGGEPKKNKVAKEPKVKIVDNKSEEKECGWFALHVKEAWRAAGGFQVFEHLEEIDDMAGVEVTLQCREWFCSKEVEPPGGFPKGKQGFVVRSQNHKKKTFPPGSLLSVKVRHKLFVEGKRSRKFIEVVDEPAKIKQAYLHLAKPPPPLIPPPPAASAKSSRKSGPKELPAVSAGEGWGDAAPVAANAGIGSGFGGGGGSAASGGGVAFDSGDMLGSVMRWLATQDPEPEPFQLQLRRTYTGHWEGDMIVDDETNTFYTSPALWAKVRKIMEDGKESKGFEVKISYKGLNLVEREDNAAVQESKKVAEAARQALAEQRHQQALEAQQKKEQKEAAAAAAAAARSPAQAQTVGGRALRAAAAPAAVEEEGGRPTRAKRSVGDMEGAGAADGEGDARPAKRAAAQRAAAAVAPPVQPPLTASPSARTAAPLTSSPAARPRFEVGTALMKHFEGVPFVGWVVAVSRGGAGMDLYNIRYEDGDVEDLEYDELAPLVWPTVLRNKCTNLRPGQLVAYWNTTPPGGDDKSRVRFDIGQLSQVHGNTGSVWVQPFKCKKPQAGGKAMWECDFKAGQKQMALVGQPFVCNGVIAGGFAFQGGSDSGVLENSAIKAFEKAGLLC